MPPTPSRSVVGSRVEDDRPVILPFRVSTRRFRLVCVLTMLLVAGAALAGEVLDLDVSLEGRPDLVVTETGNTIRWSGLSSLTDTNFPGLPYRDVQIVLPPGTRAASARVSPVEERRGWAGASLDLMGPSVNSEGGVVSVAGTPAEAGTFPAAWGRLLGTEIRHGCGIATVRLHPVTAVAGASGAWTVDRWADAFDIRLQLVADARDRAETLRASSETAARRLAGTKAGVVNPEALSAYARPIVAKSASASPTFAPTAAPSLDGSPVDYVIVTTDDFAAAFQTLADYKTARGLRTVVRTTSWIEQTYPSSDGLSGTIRTFLRDAYERWGIAYVMIGADVEIIPTKMIYSSLYPNEIGSELPVDLYYACLDGDWNADGDGIFGETSDDVDLSAELYLGRAPVKTVADIEVLVDKIMAYERDAVDAHVGEFLFLSEVLSPSEYASGLEIYTDGASYSERIIDDVLSSRSVGYSRYYEAYDLWPGSQPETKSSVLSALGSGDYGFVNHIGHGFVDIMSVGDNTLKTRDVRSLDNAPHYYVLNNLNCASAAFDNNSIIERFITHPDGGAVLSIGSSRAAFPSVATQFQYSLYEALFDQGAETLGEAHALCREPYLGAAEDNSIERWTVFSLVLIGDPTLRAWTSAPESLVVSAPDTLVLGSGTRTVAVSSGGEPLAGARVCLYKEDDCYAVATTDATGEAEIAVTLNTPGEAYLSVEAPNRYIHEDTLPVVSAGVPVLALAGLDVFDDGTYGSMGNGDGFPDAGETVALLPTFVNDGGTAAPDSTPVSLCDGLDGVTPLVDLITAPPLVSGGSAAGDTALLIQLDPEIEDGTRLVLQLVSTDGGQTLDAEYRLEIRAPVLMPGVMTWSDVGTGNGNSTIEAGETVRINLMLRNTGAGVASGLSGWLETDIFGVNVVQGETTWPDIGASEEIAQDTELQLYVFMVSSAYQAVLHVTDAYGREIVHTFDLMVPDPVDIVSLEAPGEGRIELSWEPSTAENVLGYHVYRSVNANFGYERITDLPTSGALFEDSGLEPFTRYYYKVRVLAESRLRSGYSAMKSFDTNPGLAPGFPCPMVAETSSHVAVGDVDGDGRPEIVTAADAIYVLHEDGTELRDGDSDPETVGPFHNNGEIWTPAGVTLGDLTDDPGLEIVASCRSTSQIYVFESDGGIADGWPRSLNNWNWSTPAVGDLDADGDNEIVATSVQGRTYAWHHDGTEVIDGDDDPSTTGVFHVRSSEWYQYGSPVLADLDGDDLPEVLIGTRHSDGSSDVLHALSLDGTEPDGWPYDLGVWCPTLTSPAVADLDGDGVLEIVFVSENDKLHVVDQTGAAVSPFPIAFTATGTNVGIATPSPALGDLDGDGRLDIVAVEVFNTHEGEVHAITIDGVELTGWPRTVEGNSESSPIVGDVSGNGLPDVIFGIGGGSDTGPNLIYGFRDDGSDLKGFPIATVGPVRATPALADMGDDGDVDLIYAGWDLAVHVWDLEQPYDPLNMPWPTFQGNVARTGVFALEDPYTDVETPGALLRLDLEQNSPNPFNPVTRIAFTLPDGYDGRVRLHVYDLLGRRVRTLVDGRLGAGRHTTAWSGRDESERACASGVYLYRLSTENGTKQGRMTLVR